MYRLLGRIFGLRRNDQSFEERTMRERELERERKREREREREKRLIETVM